MTWLVTGGSGFVGIHLLRSLRDAGIPARSLDLAPLGPPPAEVEEIVADIRDVTAVRRSLQGVDVVVHAAAALPSRPSELESVNVDGSLVVARAARDAGVRRSVFVSSAVVYGLLPPPVSETAVPHPVEAYGRSKLRAERAWLSVAPGAVVLRPSAVVGPERLGVFGILFRWIGESRRIYLLGAGRNRYQLLDVADLVGAIRRAGDEGEAGDVLNVGGRISGSTREDLEAVIRHAGSSSRVTSVPAPLARSSLRALEALRLSPLTAWHRLSADRDVVLDCSCALERLDWQPTQSGAQALCRAYDWFAAAGRGPAHGATHRQAWDERALAVLRRIS